MIHAASQSFIHSHPSLFLSLSLSRAQLYSSLFCRLVDTSARHAPKVAPSPSRGHTFVSRLCVFMCPSGGRRAVLVR
ncbi:unnamed protein product [Protopolystoma xenopodis]|uniref:Uncharacterized protein n=1 Tax=Protopolystoma xenopodis TaxID=117903 RepID=A0A3S5BNP3_9PLAT|nr:unnamed protein product [Protopolystoma xenopodis]